VIHKDGNSVTGNGYRWIPDPTGAGMDIIFCLRLEPVTDLSQDEYGYFSLPVDNPSGTQN
jgi:hypothetical protein